MSIIPSITDRLQKVRQLLRPQQWLKNLFVFIPLFFDRHLLDGSYLSAGFVVFAAWCFTASSIYCFNDIYDREDDRLHPRKRFRPIASGTLSVAEGYAWMGVMLVLGILTLSLLPAGRRWTVTGILLFYFVMNLGYCIRLKRYTLVDVFIIATGFVLRLLSGGEATQIRLSHWIVLMTFLLALFIAFAKRRDDVVIYENAGVMPRRNMNRYNLTFMNQAISIVASITMVCYIMYTVSEEVIRRMGTSFLYITSVFVLAGIIRYLQLTIVDLKSGSPTKVLMKDRFLQGCIVAWILSFVVILYL